MRSHSTRGTIINRTSHNSLLFILITAALAIAAAAPAPLWANDDPIKISPEKLTEEIAAQNADIHYGGLMIHADQTVTGPVVIVDGALDIQDGAVLEGDAWVVNGNVVITGGGKVNGRLNLVNSQTYASHDAAVTGGTTHYKSQCRIDAAKYQREGRLVFVKFEDPTVPHISPAALPGLPTRVRYDLIRIGVQRECKETPEKFSQWRALVHIPAYISTQHGFLGFDVTGRIPLTEGGLALTLDGYKILHTEDSWQVSRIENAAMLVAAGSEYANYFEKRGGKAGLVWKSDGFVKVGLFGFYQEDVSMETRKTFTLFGDDDDLPENPAIEDGYRAAGMIGAAYDSREDIYANENAWFLGCTFEAGRHSPHADGADSYDYSAFTVETNRYNRLPMGFQWDIGARLSSAFDRIPHQLYQTLNGYGGIRGTNRIPFDVDRGDRMIRVSTELRYELPSLPIVNWVYSTWHLLGFADAGLLAQAESPTSTFGFLDTSFSNWKKSVGAGISGESFFPYFGIYVAKEIDGDRKSPRVIVRIEKTF